MDGSQDVQPSSGRHSSPPAEEIGVDEQEDSTTGILSEDMEEVPPRDQIEIPGSRTRPYVPGPVNSLKALTIPVAPVSAVPSTSAGHPSYTTPEGATHTPAARSSQSARSKMKMIDSGPPSLGFCYMYWKMKVNFDQVEIRQYQDRQRFAECGYVSLHGIFRLKHTDLEWLPEKMFDGDERFTILCNTIISGCPLYARSALYLHELETTVANLEFLEVNFEINVTDRASDAQAIYLCIMSMKWEFERPDRDPYVPWSRFSQNLLAGIDYFKGQAKPDQMFWINMEKLKQLVEAECPDFEALKDTFFLAIEQLRIPTCPEWFAGVFEPNDFVAFIEGSIASARTEDIRRIAIVNTRKWPGQHWYTLCYVLPKIVRDETIVKAT